MSDKNIVIPKSRIKKVLIVLGIIFLLAIGGIAYVFTKSLKEMPIVENQVNQFMTSITNKNVEEAYNLTARDFKKEITLEKFQSLIDYGTAQFTGFKSLKLESFHVESHTGKPTFYSYSGPITYTNGDQGTIKVTLVKEEGKYKIYYFNVSVDPARGQLFEKK